MQFLFRGMVHVEAEKAFDGVLGKKSFVAPSYKKARKGPLPSENLSSNEWV
jgi:hypothetical protein